jgi:glycosyltransferase involved in cell wall biosynthesis
MRIALIHYRLVRNGGLETRLLNYISHFSALGHEVTVIVAKVDSSILLPKGVHLHHVNLSHVPKPLRQFFLDRALPDIMAAQKFDLSLSLGRTSHQQMVLCPGNHLGYLKALGKWWRNPIDLLNVHMDRRAFSNSSCILAASQMMRNELVDLYAINASKIKVLGPPTDVARFNNKGKEAKVHWRALHGFSDRLPTVLFLSTGNKLKGYSFVLQLMHELAGAPVELVIAGMKPMHTDLPNVRYVGYAQRPEELLWAADLLILPSLYEAFGQVVTESLQCGTPVLISDKVGAKEIVDGSVGCVISGTDVHVWKSAVLEMISQTWDIPSDVAQRHNLTLEQHCTRILELASELPAY